MKATLPRERVPAASSEPVIVEITTVRDEDGYDITDAAAYLAFTPAGADPDTGDWIPAQWQSTVDSYLVYVHIGPKYNNALAKGSYVVWLRIDDVDEEPVRDVARLVVY